MTQPRLPTPTDLRDFLKSQGWSAIESSSRHRLYLLENSSHPRRQLVFPMDMAAPDYADSVGGVLDKLAEMTATSRHAVDYKLRSLRDDVLKLRLSFNGNDTALPLTFASTFIASTEKLLKSVAGTVLRPRAHNPRLSFAEANQFVAKSRFGQTQEGSFIVRVECPINSMEVQGSLGFGEDVPFVRQVTSTLQSALLQLTTAIETDHLDSLIDELKQSPAPLVSSNLCEAISGMHDDLVDNGLEVAVDWSALVPLASGVPSHPIRIQRDYFARIDEVQRELRPTELHEEETFVGTVERLEGEMGTDGRRSGSVLLSLLLPDEGETVRARTVLNAESYELADRAHMTNGSYVVITGRLRPGRQPRQLTHCSKFGLLAG